MSVLPSAETGLAMLVQLVVAHVAGQFFVLGLGLVCVGFLWQFATLRRPEQRLSQSLFLPTQCILQAPSISRVGLIIFSNAQLYVVSLLLLHGIIFRHDTREWLLLGVMFAFAMVIGMLFELRWRTGAEGIFAFNAGTVAVFLLLLLQHAFHMQFAFIATGLTVLLAVNIAFLVLLSIRINSRSIPFVFFLTLVTWLIIRSIFLA